MAQDNLRRDRYHHGDLANALTLAATDLAREGGPEAVVLRQAARQVGVSATAAYRHRGRKEIGITFNRIIRSKAAHRQPGDVNPVCINRRCLDQLMNECYHKFHWLSRMVKQPHSHYALFA